MAERADDATPAGAENLRLAVAEAWAAAGLRRLGLGGAHNDG